MIPDKFIIDIDRSYANAVTSNPSNLTNNINLSIKITMQINPVLMLGGGNNYQTPIFLFSGKHHKSKEHDPDLVQEYMAQNIYTRVMPITRYNLRKL